MYTKKLLLLTLLNAFLMHSAHAIVMHGRPLKIEVSKGKDGKLSFDVVNLKTLKTAKGAAKWCWQLHEGSRGKPDPYSNSVYIYFGEGITKDEMQLTCDIFMMTKVYILEIKSIVNGQVKTYEHQPDLENLMRLAGFDEETLKKVRKRKQAGESNR